MSIASVLGPHVVASREEDLRIDSKVCREGAHSLTLLGRRRLDPIKLAYNKPVVCLLS